MIRRKTLILLVLLALMLYFSKGYLSGTGMSVLQKQIIETSDKPIEVYFCPRDDCTAQLLAYISRSTTIHCALFELDLEPVIAALQEKQALVVVDKEYNEIPLDFARKDKEHHLMHNKFCIFDNVTVWTGSMNPKHTDTERNNNNVVVIHSPGLAQNYETEFQELWNGQFGKGQRNQVTEFIVNGTRIENYFCPEDWCANRVMEALNASNQSIYFMTFSFTHDQIGEVLIRKFIEGVDVKGVFEKSQENAYTEFTALRDAGIPVQWDTNKYNLHHKVFIIDNKTVVTGSFNPTRNGDVENDENLLIIHDAALAARFLQEFEQVYS